MKNLYKLLKQKGFPALAARVRGPYENPDAIREGGIDLYFSVDIMKVRVEELQTFSTPIKRFRVTRQNMDTAERDEQELEALKQDILEETHARMVKIRETFVQLMDGLLIEAAGRYTEEVEKKQK